MAPRGRPGYTSINELIYQIGDWIVFIVLGFLSDDTRG